jgi:alkylhydroperoxidase/carboxymuconolactone decarboxylase family protein YurZ
MKRLVMVDANEVAAFLERWQADRRPMKEHAPDIARGFGGLHPVVMKDGALSVREKKPIALGIGLASRRPPCINLHVQGCLDAVATREQIVAAAVAVQRAGVHPRARGVARPATPGIADVALVRSREDFERFVARERPLA